MWAHASNCEDLINNIENAHKSQVCGNKMFVAGNINNACPKPIPFQEGTSKTSISEEHNDCKIENVAVMEDTNSHEIPTENIDYHRGMAKLEYVHNLPIKEEMSYRSIHHCDECGYESKSIFFMLNHVRRHRFPSQLFDCATSNVELYYCKNCDVNFDSVVHLRNHIKEQSTSDILSNTNLVEMKDKQWFHCGTCTYKAVQKQHLKMHIMAKHTRDEDKKWFNCEKCTYKAIRKDYLNIHIMAKHTHDKDKKWFYCEKCTYKATQKSDLNRHIMAKHVHDTVKKWFRCEKCTFKTTWKANLKKHIMEKHTHDKDKKCFKCERCTYKATRKTNLNQHIMAYHTDDKNKKWFKCEMCTHKTIQKGNLNKHIKAKHIQDKKD